MDKDYQNFVDRMGSFEDTMDVSGENLTHNSLSHHGVLGMKWGRRKGVNATTIGAAARTGKSVTELGKTVAKSGRSSKSLKTLEKAKTLTDDDLKKLTNRLNLENNYVNANTQQSGASRVEGILAVAGGVLAAASSAAILYETIKKFD